MKIRIAIVMLTGAVALGISGAAVAGESQPTAASSDKEKANPEEIVCEKVTQPGSRLVTKRVCATRAEWAERRRTERMDVEKQQVQRGTAGKGQ